jgi:hypothetical protein
MVRVVLKRACALLRSPETIRPAPKRVPALARGEATVDRSHAVDRPSARTITTFPHRARLKQALGIIYTRDHVEPLFDDDRGMTDSWRCVPVPPSIDDDWIIIDSSDDYKTGWMRRVDLQGGGA